MRNIDNHKKLTMIKATIRALIIFVRFEGVEVVVTIGIIQKTRETPKNQRSLFPLPKMFLLKY
ncbi:MAG: hypothetical protein NUK65_08945, partial [Firmicutes bacterium]|nr:hypothetical protein [Bacillota bacterium]